MSELIRELISRQKLKPCPFCGERAFLDTDENWYWKWKVECPGCGCDLGYYDTGEEAIEAWNRRAEPPTDPWIPCSERLPKQYERVLVTATVMQTVFLKESKVAVDVGYLITEGVNEFILSAAGTRQYAKAWMPLPEPYKGVE